MRNHITRDRFQLLLKRVHLNDNQQVGQQNKLQKIQPLLNKLCENFRSVYTLGSVLVIDESLIPFRGRVIFRQYIPVKSHKYGIKLYKLCTPSSYTWNLFVYSGNMKTEPSFQHSESVVLQLCKPLLKQGSTIYADNFYSSIPLVEKLLQEKMYYYGTVQKNWK